MIFAFINYFGVGKWLKKREVGGARYRVVIIQRARKNMVIIIG